MDVALIFGIILVLLFLLAFLTKRRFGLIGLALAAGAMLSSLWASTLTPVIQNAGVVIERPPLVTIVAVSLVLLPAIILLFSGPSYKHMPMRLFGAFCFAALALAVLIEPLGSALILQGESKQVYDFFVQNRVYIVTAGLIFALFDILVTFSKHHHKAHKD